MKEFFNKLKSYFVSLSKNCQSQEMSMYKPTYRLVHIEKNKFDNYEVTIQVVGKSKAFKAKPEEILADDRLTDQFSPRDIRALTYLGYLDINSPKYRILAKKLSEEDNRMFFVIHKKGDKKARIKTASEISQDKEIIKQIDQHDAHLIGFTVASESMLEEKKTKEEIIKQSRLKDNY